MGSVHQLDQPREARSVVRRLREQLRSGMLVPGSELKVSELAAHHCLRPQVLAQELDRLVDEGLLTVYLDRVTVAALNPRALAANRRLRNGVALPLYEEAHRHVSLTELDRIESRLKAAVGPTLVGSEEHPAGDAVAWGKAICDVNLRLSRAAGSAPLLRAFGHLLADTRRYNSLGWGILLRDNDARTVLRLRNESLGYCIDLIDSLRSKNPRAVQDAVLRQHADACFIAEASLVPEHTAPGDRHSVTRSRATVIDIAGRLSARRAAGDPREMLSLRGTVPWLPHQT